MKFFFILFIVFFSSSFLFAKTGFYSSSFDPPTTDEIELVRNFLQEAEIDTLILMIDRISRDFDGYNASAGERAEMLKVGLGDLGSRVRIVVEPWSGKKTYLNTLRTQDDLHIIEKKEVSIQKIPSEVYENIKIRKLYNGISESMIPLKKSLYQEAYKTFLREISLLFPNENLLNIPIPSFNPLMSHLGCADQFICSVIREKQFNSEKAEQFGKKAEKVLISSERDELYAKLHFLHGISVNQTIRPVVTLYPFELPFLPNDQKHTLDIEIYCSDRFPKALFTSSLFQENGTYFHMGSTEEAIAYHLSEGFTEVYEVNSQAVRKIRNYHLLKNPITCEIRFVVSNLHGEDMLNHVAYQFNEIAKFTNVHLVRHANPSSLFEVNPDLKDMIFQSTDILIIGFKNAISRLLLENSDWKKMTYSNSGIAIDFYENIRTTNHIILVKCVYGDQLLELLNFFYSKGIKKFQYFGTSGSLCPSIHIGDAIIPLAYSTPQNSFIPFQNKAADILQGISNERVKLVNLHGWTQSPVLETISFLENLQKEGNQSIDVEGRYYGEFFHTHPDAVASMVLFVSDEPFGDLSLDHFNTMSHLVDEAFDTVIDRFLP